jgi:hypothetical protein
MQYSKIFIIALLVALLLPSCSRSQKTIKVKKVASHTANEHFVYGGKAFVSNGTLDYEDAIRDKCSNFPQNSYRYTHNANYRNGWVEASKKC